jgi:2Fe-2S ferredoxin
LLEPAGFSFVAFHGEPLMRAAQRAGVRWPTVCGGKAECGVCFVEVLPDSIGASPAQPVEIDRLSHIFAKTSRGGRLRLACQLRVESDLHVFRQFVRINPTPDVLAADDGE